MSWRVVVVSQRCKLDYSMNYVVVRGNETKRILLDEIAVMIIENNAVSMTGCLLSMLIEKKVKVIFCDAKRNPQAEMIPIYGAHNDAKRIREQMAWGEDSKQTVWTRIVREKIRNQAKILEKYEKTQEAGMLFDYIDEMLPGDVSNREGHAAKVYFNSLFGAGFHRGDEEHIVNKALNYGYAILLSAFNREIVASGLLTQLGIGHDNQFNHFNLSCDLMEPFRIFVDDRVRRKELRSFQTDEKHDMVDLLNDRITICGTEQTILNAIRIYTKSVIAAIEESDVGLIHFFDL